MATNYPWRNGICESCRRVSDDVDGNCRCRHCVRKINEYQVCFRCKYEANILNPDGTCVTCNIILKGKDITRGDLYEYDRLKVPQDATKVLCKVCLKIKDKFNKQKICKECNYEYENDVRLYNKKQFGIGRTVEDMKKLSLELQEKYNREDQQRYEEEEEYKQEHNEIKLKRYQSTDKTYEEVVKQYIKSENFDEKLIGAEGLTLYDKAQDKTKYTTDLRFVQPDYVPKCVVCGGPTDVMCEDVCMKCAYNESTLRIQHSYTIPSCEYCTTEMIEKNGKRICQGCSNTQYMLIQSMDSINTKRYYSKCENCYRFVKTKYLINNKVCETCYYRPVNNRIRKQEDIRQRILSEETKRKKEEEYKKTLPPDTKPVLFCEECNAALINDEKCLRCTNIKKILANDYSNFEYKVKNNEDIEDSEDIEGEEDDSLDASSNVYCELCGIILHNKRKKKMSNLWKV